MVSGLERSPVSQTLIVGENSNEHLQKHKETAISRQAQVTTRTGQQGMDESGAMRQPLSFRFAGRVAAFAAMNQNDDRQPTLAGGA